MKAEPPHAPKNVQGVRIARRLISQRRSLVVDDALWTLSADLMLKATWDGRITSANPAWTKILGWSTEQVVGANLFEQLHPDDELQARELSKNAGNDAVVRFDGRCRHRDGGYRWVQWAAQRDDDLITAVGRDMTVEKEHGDTKRDLEDFRRLAFSGVGGVGVWTYEVASDMFFCDDVIAGIYAIDATQAASGILRKDFLANVLADDRPALAATMAGGLERSGDLELEYRLLHPDGSVHWVMSRGHTYFDDDGRAVRRTGVGIDITRQRRLEEQLRQSQKLEAVGQLTGGIAHDFNNLLTVIRTSIDLLRRPDLADAKRVRFMESISTAAARAAKLTGQLLAFARRQTLQPDVFDAGQNVRALTAIVETLSGGRIVVDLDLSDMACYVRADPSQFDTAVVNLAVNARDAMVDGGRLSLRVREAKLIPPIRGHATVHGDYVAVTVIDNGTGIDNRYLVDIFEPFYTTKGVGQGTGLGLSQVFGFAKQSGGEIQVESTLGKGSTFTLYLPQADPKDAPASEDSNAVRASAVALPGAGERILIVEDNADVAASVEQSVQAIGYSTEMATSGEDALATLSADSSRFKAVFTDVVMPGMSGIELAREIERRHRGLAIVLSSGYSHVLANGDQHGFVLLPKPYSVEDLAHVLRDAVSRRAPSVGSRRGRLHVDLDVQPGVIDATEELARQVELDAMRVMDSESEPDFDELVDIASRICNTPIALVSLVDADRQWFKARLGLDATETPRIHSFCTHAIAQPATVMIVPDATHDDRFIANPLVTGESSIRFYAGAPLVTSNGYALGTLCVIDRVPRQLTANQVGLLKLLADRVVERIEERKAGLGADPLRLASERTAAQDQGL